MLMPGSAAHILFLLLVSISPPGGREPTKQMPQKHKILIVDDEAPIRFLIAQALVSQGYTVKTAESGLEALQIAGAEAFSLIMTDLIMPGKDGIETILALKSKHPKTRIIAMSGGFQGGKSSYLPLAGKIGACRTLAKPFGIAAMFEAIESEIGKPHKAVA
jgi:DNA-binding NtrC family response regulator